MDQQGLGSEVYRVYGLGKELPNIEFDKPRRVKPRV